MATWSEIRAFWREKGWRLGPLAYAPIGSSEDRYMDRWGLFTPLGSLWLHKIHRADNDLWPHDHEWDFWILPLVSYMEMVLVGTQQEPNKVEAWRVHYRRAEYAHRIIGHPRSRLFDVMFRREQPIWTLVWKGRPKRRWGFWVRHRQMIDGIDHVSWVWTDATRYLAEVKEAA